MPKMKFCREISTAIVSVILISILIVVNVNCNSPQKILKKDLQLKNSTQLLIDSSLLQELQKSNNELFAFYRTLRGLSQHRATINSAPINIYNNYPTLVNLSWNGNEILIPPNVKAVLGFDSISGAVKWAGLERLELITDLNKLLANNLYSYKCKLLTDGFNRDTFLKEIDSISILIDSVFLTPGKTKRAIKELKMLFRASMIGLCTNQLFFSRRELNAEALKEAEHLFNDINKITDAEEMELYYQSATDLLFVQIIANKFNEKIKSVEDFLNHVSIIEKYFKNLSHDYLLASTIKMGFEKSIDLNEINLIAYKLSPYGKFYKEYIKYLVKNNSNKTEANADAIVSIDGKQNVIDSVIKNRSSQKYLLVDFWASWCAPCIEKMPELKKIHASNKKMDVLYLSIDKDVVRWKNASKTLMLTADNNFMFLSNWEAAYIKAQNIESIPRYMLFFDGKLIKDDLVLDSLNDYIK